MSLTAEEREHIRTVRSDFQKDTTRRKVVRPVKQRAPQTIIESQVDALHFGLSQLRHLVDAYAVQLSNVRAELVEQRVTSKWLEAEREILMLRMRVAELEQPA